MSRKVTSELCAAVSAYPKPTMLPFLYSTRTIAPVWQISKRRYQTKLQSQVRNISGTSKNCFYQSSFRTSDRNHATQDPDIDEDIVPWEDTMVEETQNKDGAPSDIAQTPSAARAKNILIDEWEDADALDAEEDSQRLSGEEAPEAILAGAEGELMNTSPTSPPSQSTITITERETFKRIFSDIFSRSRMSEANDNILSPPTTQKQQQQLYQTVDSIMAEAVAGHKKPAMEFSNTQDMVAAVERYPPSLRMAAAKAIGLVTEKAPKKPREHSEDRLEELRRPETERIEKAMREAKSDMALWKVMEKHVFSMAKNFVVEDRPTPIDKLTPSVDKKGTKKKAQSPEQVQKKLDRAHSAAADTHQKRLETLHITAPLYPAFLLLGFRLLDNSFSEPSPLALNVLPRIKSLGLVSHAFGASIPLYDELIRIYWFRYGDARQCAELLREMELVGLEFNDQIRQTLNLILGQHSQVKNDTLRKLWSLPEFSASTFVPWWKKASMEDSSRK